MAVYERTYKGYLGGLTPAWSRFLVLPRYTLKIVFASRIFLAFFVGCFIPSVSLGVIIYLTHNMKILQLLGIRPGDLALVDSQLFMNFLWSQGFFLGFVMVLIVGPALLSADMSNNALPLYLSRPFNRTEYVLGKMSVLMILLSAITWIPNLILFFFQGYMAGWEWTSARLHVPIAIFLSSWIWILTLSLLALAISASVKRKMTARVLLFGTVTILGAFGGIIGEGMGQDWGHNLNLIQSTTVIWAALFGASGPPEPSVWTAWITPLAAVGVSLMVLSRKIRAYEVVR